MIYDTFVYIIERHLHPVGMHRSVEQQSTLSLHSVGMHPCLINLWMHPYGMHNVDVIALLPSDASLWDANMQNNSVCLLQLCLKWLYFIYFTFLKGLPAAHCSAHSSNTRTNAAHCSAHSSNTRTNAAHCSAHSFIDERMLHIAALIRSSTNERCTVFAPYIADYEKKIIRIKN
jgi:hypothetical protein